MRPPGRARSVSPLTSITRSSPPDSSSSCNRRAEPSPSAATMTRCRSPSSSAMRRPSPSPSPTTGSHPVAATTAVSGRSAVGRTVQRRRRRVREQASKGSVQARERRCPPRPRSRSGVAAEVGLLVEELAGAVAHAAGLDQHDLRVGVEQVDEQRARRSVSHGSHDSMPSNTWPSASRSHCSRPHGSAPTSARGALAHLVGGQQLAAGRSRPRSRSSVERWSATENSERRSTSSPHRSMRTGRSAVDGNTSTIEPRTATSPRCSTWYSRR